MIANARMYAVNPRIAAAWRAVLEWVIAAAGVRAEVIDYAAPQPLPALWARADLGCAFMCGYPLAGASPPPVILAAPVPALAAYAGQPRYWTNLVVRADSPFLQLSDVFGQRVAYTTIDSQSGYQAPRSFLAPYAQARGGALFAATVGPLVTPRAVVDALLTGSAEVGPLDSYFHDLLRASEPAAAAQLRTLGATTPTPIPALVAAPAIAAGDAHRLRAALLEVGAAPALASARETLLLDGFAAVAAADYQTLLAAARAADALGYPRLV